MKAVELFAGIGGFRIACDSLGIQTVWANDIDDKAAKVYVSNFGDDVFVPGDIKQHLHQIPAHDLLTAGFPCQPFSSAGKKDGIRDPRGTLFQEIVKVVKEHHPSFFVLENVKRLLSMEEGQHFATILYSLAKLGYYLEWRVLNAADFGLAQNRERLFIIGFGQKLQDEAHLLIPEESSRILSRTLSKLISGSWQSIGRHAKRFPNWGVAFGELFVAEDLPSLRKIPSKVRLKDILEKDVDESFDYTDQTRQRLGQSRRVEKFVNGVEIIYNQNGGARMGYTIFGTRGLAPTLTSATSRHYERYQIGDRYRRLTNMEYARLQGFPDSHCRTLTVYDQYYYYGNAVPPVMAKWVLSRILNNTTTVISIDGTQLGLFPT